jgi:hypothetical protein
MKLIVSLFSCDSTVSRCSDRYYGRNPRSCLPSAPYRYGNTTRVNGKFVFGCHNRCA